MPLFEITGSDLVSVSPDTFTAIGLREREHLQRAVRANIQAISEDLMVIAEEFSDWVGALRRVDLLCLDRKSQLVIVELKRDDSAHMELQALRYAAMVSTMRFDQAVEAHRKYLIANGDDRDPEACIREFLDEATGPVVLADSVRIVLASSDFSTEVTTTVLWLNEKLGLDISCVQIRPHRFGDRVLLDVQQLIPLPSAEKYRIALRDKAIEQTKARQREVETSRFELAIGEDTHLDLPRPRLVYEMVAEALRRNVSRQALNAVVPWRSDNMFLVVPGTLSEEAFAAAFPGEDMDRYFASEADLFRVNGETFALSSRWSTRAPSAARKIAAVLPDGAPIVITPVPARPQVVAYGEFTIRQLPSGTIEVLRDGELLEVAKPALRDMAKRLGVATTNGKGNDMNTRQLGAQIMQAVTSSTSPSH